MNFWNACFKGEPVSKCLNLFAQLENPNALINDRTPFAIAVHFDHKELVKEMLSLSLIDYNRRCAKGCLPIANAIHNGNTEIVRLLLPTSTSLENVDGRGSSALLLASSFGHVEMVKLLLPLVNVNKGNNFNETPLFCASNQGSLEIVNLLLDAGAFVDLADDEGFTPMFVAAGGGHLNVVERLLKAGANPYVKNKELFSPLFFAAQNGHESVVDLLLNVEPRNIDDVNGVGDGQSTPLFVACDQNKVRAVEVLLRHGANANCIQPDTLKTPLHFAVGNGNMEIVKLLCEYDAVIDHEDTNNITPMLRACQKDNYAMVIFLLERGAATNFAEALITVCNFGCCLELVDLFIRIVGVNVSRDSITPLFCACEKGQTRIVAHLLSDKGIDIEKANNEKVTPLHVACGNGHTQVVELMLKAGAQVNSRSKDEISPIIACCVNGNVDVLRLLVKYGANVREVMDKLEWTLLHAAASKNHVEMVRVLVKEYKLSSNIKTKKGSTPLMIAAFAGHADAVILLLDELGANPELFDDDDCSALYLGCDVDPNEFEHVRLVEKLIEHLHKRKALRKMMLQKADTTGYTCLHLAASHNSLAMVKLLLKHMGQQLLTIGDANNNKVPAQMTTNAHVYEYMILYPGKLRMLYLMIYLKRRNVPDLILQQLHPYVKYACTNKELLRR